MLPMLPSTVLPKPQDPCSRCVGRSWSQYGDMQGFVPASGSGRNGVLIVLEAAGAEEELEATPVVGKAGYYLFSQLAKIDLQRDDFRIHNVLSCRPPGNKLAGEPYYDAAVTTCSPLLDATIHEHVAACHGRGQTPVILALGKIAFSRLSGWRSDYPGWKVDYQCYVHWSDRYSCCIIAADHPSYLMRGQHQIVPVLQFAAQRAVDVAREGFRYDEPRYLCDPEPAAFASWVRDYKAALGGDAPVYLSVDIETPTKQKKGDDQLAREEDEDYIILRCGFAFRPGEAVSIPWRADYMWAVEELLGDQRNRLVTWNGNYDLPRLRNQLTVWGENHDAMLAWHVLNSALEKRLGFVAPFYVKNARMWKHLSGETPAYYNAADADIALRCYLGIRADLERARQLHVFDRHIIELHKVTDHMSAAGLLRDERMRAEAEAELTGLLTRTEERMYATVPEQARREKVYKTKPRDAAGVLERPVRTIRPVCSVCGLVKPPKPHTTRKTVVRVCESSHLDDLCRGTERVANPCFGADIVQREVEAVQYYKLLDWKASTVQLKNYQASLKHQAVINRRENRVTFDEDAIRQLLRKYPSDPLYPLLLEHRKYQKLRGTYIGVTQADGSIKGGLRVGRDGRIHPEYTDNPSTLRMACQNPNMQQLPRTSKDDRLVSLVRNLVVAGEGYTLLERDFSAIEAVLVAYFARWADGIRVAKLGIHAYLASHVLKRPADLSWSDADLRAYLKEIKKSEDPHVQQVYNGCKRTTHLCLTGEHEVMTHHGWQRLDELKDHQGILCWNPESGGLEWWDTQAVTRDPFDGELTRWSGRALSAVMTDEHEVPFTQDAGGRIYRRAHGDVPQCGRIPVTGVLEGGRTVSWPLMQLVVAAQADSTIRSRGSISFHLHKQRKIQRLRGILRQLSFRWSERPCKCGGVYIGVRVGDALWPWLDQVTKTFKFHTMVELSTVLRRQVLAELLHWDGSTRGHIRSYSTKEAANADVAQMLAHTTGSQALIRHVYVDGVRYHTVSFNRRQYARRASLRTARVRHTGTVYCVTVPTGYFFVRHNNRVSVTGNSGYGGTPRKMHQAEPEVFPTEKYARWLQDIYWEVASPVKRWQLETQLEAHQNGHLRNPYGYVHRFTHVFRHVKEAGRWVKKPGDQANEVLAFLPQSTAAGIIKEAMLRLFQRDEARPWLRLQVHDSLVLEVPDGIIDEVDAVLQEEMERPCRELPLPASYGMGSHLVIDTERKAGKRWGEVK